MLHAAKRLVGRRPGWLLGKERQAANSNGWAMGGGSKSRHLTRQRGGPQNIVPRTHTSVPFKERPYRSRPQREGLQPVRIHQTNLNGQERVALSSAQREDIWSLSLHLISRFSSYQKGEKVLPHRQHAVGTASPSGPRLLLRGREEQSVTVTWDWSSKWAQHELDQMTDSVQWIWVCQTALRNGKYNLT